MKLHEIQQQFPALYRELTHFGWTKPKYSSSCHFPAGVREAGDPQGVQISGLWYSGPLVLIHACEDSGTVTVAIVRFE